MTKKGFCVEGYKKREGGGGCVWKWKNHPRSHDDNHPLQSVFGWRERDGRRKQNVLFSWRAEKRNELSPLESSDGKIPEVHHFKFKNNLFSLSNLFIYFNNKEGHIIVTNNYSLILPIFPSYQRLL